MAVQEIVEQTVAGLGYDLVEIERSAGGLLRITIDLPWSPPVTAAGAAAGTVPDTVTGPVTDAVAGLVPQQFVNVEDCEKVTRQLVFALEVMGLSTSGLRCPRPVLIARCGMKKILSALWGM